jgi:hypothetical protein
MKKRDAINEVTRALTESLRSGANRVGFIVPSTTPDTRATSSSSPAPRDPDFEFVGWQFFALTGPFENEELNNGGDAKLRTPNGTFIGLVWTTTGKLAHRFDFTPLFGPMLYVDVPAPIRAWSDLRPYFESLVPLFEAELREREVPR